MDRHTSVTSLVGSSLVPLFASAVNGFQLSIKKFLSFFCIVLLIFVAIPSNANAEPYVGLSAFAAMNSSFPCNEWLKTLQEGTQTVNKPAMAVVWGTFGSDGACVQRFLNQNRDRPHLLEIHFSNQTCLKYRRCETGELLILNDNRQPAGVEDFNRKVLTDSTFQTRIRDRIRRINQWIAVNKNSNTKAVVSLGLEDQYSRAAFEQIVTLFREVNTETPLVFETVRSPLISSYASTFFAGYTGYLELHPGNPSLDQYPSWTPMIGQPAAKPTFCITNLDGVSTPRDPDVTMSVYLSQSKSFINRHSDCLAVFLWHAPLQGLRPSRGAYSPYPSNAAPQRRRFTIDSSLISRFRCAMRTWRSSRNC